MRLIFWMSAALAGYVYAGYPLVLALIARWRRQTGRDERHQPTVSLVIAAHDEEDVLREKLDNSLALDYPRERLQIVVASDGSNDATNAIAAEYAGRDVVLRDIRPRGGKTRALNLAIPSTTGEILILSDANTMYRADAVRRLVRHFADPAVGAVSGDVRVVDSAGAYAASEGLYYRYERSLQRLESRLGSIIGADGGMYALRRSAYAPIPNSVVVDDFVISMNVACGGLRVIYDADAVAIERGTSTSGEEFSRKVRIVAGGFQALLSGQGVPSPKDPWLLWSYVSHKLLRWLMPLVLIAVFTSAAMLMRDHAIYLAAFAAQSVFYAAALLRWADVPAMTRVPGAAVPYYFCLVNAAALAGLWRATTRTQAATWQRTTRLERRS
jgi:cellulose synthase/poly-beta-1,6-N-acetylglucosamine synthase-like glycosyltransferase